MDIGNLPIFNGQNKKSTNDTPVNKSRSFDSNNTPKQAEEKNAWEQIGDYDQPASNSTNVEDEDEEEDHEQIQIPRKQVDNSNEKKESDDAASIASEAAVKATQQHNTTK